MKLSTLINSGGYVDQKGNIIHPDCLPDRWYKMFVEHDIDIKPGMPLKMQRRLANERRRKKK